MVGELPDAAQAPGSGFSGAGDAVALVGPFAPALAGSELAKQRGALAPGLPAPDVEGVAQAAAAVREAARGGQLASAHDVSDGGLAAALAEAAISGGTGVRADLTPLLESRGVGAEAALFGEGAGGFLLSGDRERLLALGDGGVEALLLGETGGDAIEIDAGEARLSVPLAEAEAAWRSLSL
jgi:phosphoribosylformylglycinamidine synthase